MKKLLLGFMLAGAMVLPAHAEEAQQETRDKSANWSLSLGGGATLYDGDGEQSSFRLGLTRNLGEGYVRASISQFSTRDGAGLVGAVPAKTVQGVIAAGHRWGKLGVDGYASLGRRSFQREAYRRDTGGMIEIDSHGRTAAAGVSLSYELDLDDRSVIAPFVAGDISRVDTARAVTVVGRGTVAQKEKQSGETGSIGFTVDRLLGKDRKHRVEAYTAFVTSSNSAIAFRSSVPAAIVTLFGPQDIPGSKDSWAEYGLTTSLRLSKPLSLDLSAIRTAGFAGRDSTSLTAAFRIRF